MPSPRETVVPGILGREPWITRCSQGSGPSQAELSTRILHCPPWGKKGADSIGEKGEERKKHSSEQLKEKLRRRRRRRQQPDGQSQTPSAPVRKSSLALNTGQNLNAAVSGPTDRLEGVSHLRRLTKTGNFQFPVLIRTETEQGFDLPRLEECAKPPPPLSFWKLF